MQDAAAVRRAALDAVDDVEPSRLNDRIEALLAESDLAPGRLTVACADATLDARSNTTDCADAVMERAAAVQLIYDGLSHTRELAAEPPWLDGDKAQGDVDILIADILVARGFYLLARTEAADDAVETVRSFGRDQTVARETDDPLEGSLERDVFELAVVAGTTAAGGTPSPALREFARDLVTGSEFSLADDVTEELTPVVSVEAQSSDGVRTSADH
jgi:hypothetical protein